MAEEKEMTNKQIFWLWLIGTILFFLTLITLAICMAWVYTPTDWTIGIMMDNNTKEVFYIINESGIYN